MSRAGRLGGLLLRQYDTDSKGGTLVSLKIFGENAPTAGGKKFSDDIVGRFRSGYQANDRPVALDKWRVTSGDPEVAEAVRALMGGEEVSEWEAKGEDNLEVFTEAPSVEIILEKPSALRQAMILWGRNGKIIRKSDGETIEYPEDLKGNPDPQAGQTLQERKQAAKEGHGAEPQIEVYFRLAEAEDLGIFKFQSGSWSMASDLAYHDVEQDLQDYYADSDEKGVRATLTLEEVSFTAKSGPRAGQVVSYTKPVLKILGAVQ